ncbi:GGDEF domain-containing protein [Azohydromonas aeria]|uniref:GGDEF domain-containing protein n=1 Tax=Azohydromonas aeria TaxID=2590212 RepID=UPI0012FA41A2|nr:GGDEF domain-containing protein [Azohydromonas aeria]
MAARWTQTLRDRLAGLSLRAQLLAGFAVLMVLTLAADGVSVLSHRRAQGALDAYVHTDHRIAKLTGDARAGLLRARRNEKDFLLRVREYGFEEARSRYVTLLQAELAGVRGHMAQARRLGTDAAFAAGAAAVEEAALRYERGFLHVVELYGRLGRRDAGLEGEFRSDARAIETLLQDQPPGSLHAGLLTLRRVEKDYLLRGLPADAGAFQRHADRFEAAVRHSALSPAGQREVLALTRAYRQRFAQYVAVDEAIEDARQDYLAAVHTVEPLLDRLDLRTDAARVATQATLLDIGHTAQWSITAVAAASMLLGLAAVLYIGRNIDRALRACMDFAARLAAGDLGARLPAQPRTEFGVLAGWLNRMADALQKNQSRLAEQAAELGRLNRALRVLSQCNETLVRAGDEAALVQEICRHVVEIGGYRLAWVGQAQLDAGRTLQPVAAAGPGQDYVRQLSLSWGEDAQRHGIGGAAVHEGRVVVVGRIGADPLLAHWHAAAQAHGLASCIGLPLRSRDGVLGALCIYAGEADAFDEAEIKVLTELADDLGYGIANLREAQQRRRFQRQLEHQAAFDTLTGLPNRATLEARLHQSMADARRHGRRLALLSVDLDRFKLVNDTLGHGLGDQLIHGAARRLEAAVRDGDTVARLGSDEFMVLLKDVQCAAEAGGIAAALLQALAAPLLLDGRELRPSASIGVSLFPDDAAELPALLRNADTAMGHAKQLGGGRVHFFAPEMNASVAARFAMEADLRRALERGELLLHYQPQASLSDGRVIGAEALLRWRHPEQGMVSPAQFIPLAEETGLIEPMGEWVLREVCRQQRAWLDRGLDVPQVAVNLSARQFRHPDLVGLVAQALRDHALQPHRLGLEITESAAMHDVERAIATAAGLRALGVGLSLDDFGTGYSSLSHLKRFPVHHLKIDRSFVNDIGTDPDDAAICTAVIHLAHSLELRVIAEGVETEAQLQYLRRQGCDEVQGYLFSKPLAAADFEALLAAGRRLALPPAHPAPANEAKASATRVA